MWWIPNEIDERRNRRTSKDTSKSSSGEEATAWYSLKYYDFRLGAERYDGVHYVRLTTTGVGIQTDGRIWILALVVKQRRDNQTKPIHWFLRLLKQCIQSYKPMHWIRSTYNIVTMMTSTVWSLRSQPFWVHNFTNLLSCYARKDKESDDRRNFSMFSIILIKEADFPVPYLPFFLKNFRSGNSILNSFYTENLLTALTHI